MWTTLLNVFQRHTLLNKLAARRNFYTVSMYDGEKVLSYINRVCHLASTLKSMDAHVDDAEIAMTILNGLPEQYSNLIVALDALGNDQAFTIDFVKSRLLQEEQRSKHRLEASKSSTKSGASALVGSTSQNYNSKVRSGASRRIECEHCGKRGHNAFKCWYLHPEKAPWAKANTTAIDMVKKVESENEKDLVRSMASGECSNVDSNKHVSSLWFIDSGASSHMTYDMCHFIKYTLIQPHYVEVGDKSKVLAVGKGTVLLSIIVNGMHKKCLLSNVLHVPDLAYNLLSVSAMDAKDIKTSFFKGQCNMIKNNRVLAQGYRLGGLYALCIAPNDDSVEFAAVASLQLWHARLGHVNCHGIKQMVNKHIVDGITLKDANMSHVCEACVKGKIHCSPIPKHSETRSTGLLDLVHSDICGPMQVPSLGGSRYFVSFIDDYSKWATVYMMKTKSECFSYFLEFKAMVELETGRKIKVLRTDNGGEYMSNLF